MAELRGVKVFFSLSSSKRTTWSGEPHGLRLQGRGQEALVCVVCGWDHHELGLGIKDSERLEMDAATFKVPVTLGLDWMTPLDPRAV